MAEKLSNLTVIENNDQCEEGGKGNRLPTSNIIAWVFG